MCGNLLFNADRALPWVFNLTGNNEWKTIPDAIINENTKKKISFKKGNFKKYNNQAIIDVPFEITLLDIKEKYEFVRKTYERIELINDPVFLERITFNQNKWMNYMQNKINEKKISKQEIDETGKQILKLRKDYFLSNYFEKNYKHSNRYKKLYKSIRRKFL